MKVTILLIGLLFCICTLGQSKFISLMDTKNSSYKIVISDTILGKIEVRTKNGKIKGDGMLIKQYRAVISGTYVGHEKSWVEVYIKASNVFTRTNDRYVFIIN